MTACGGFLPQLPPGRGSGGLRPGGVPTAHVYVVRAAAARPARQLVPRSGLAIGWRICPGFARFCATPCAMVCATPPAGFTICENVDQGDAQGPVDRDELVDADALVAVLEAVHLLAADACAVGECLLRQAGPVAETADVRADLDALF